MKKLVIIAAKSALALVSLVAIGLLVFSGWLVWYYDYGAGLPTEAQIAAISPTGTACATNAKRTHVALAEIPPLVRDATIAYEQPDFYEAWTLNPIAGIALAMVAGRRPSAGITHYVAHCFLSLTPEGSRQTDSIASIFLMQRVNSSLSRDRILEIYLNESYRGRGAYGVAAAAEAYFEKPLANLNIDEIAFIASRARLPSPRRSFDTHARDIVIDRMLAARLIGESEATAAKSRPLLVKDWPSDQAKPANP